MNPIKLTKEHEEKLFKMGRTLFPKYDFDKWGLTAKWEHHDRGKLKIGLKNNLNHYEKCYFPHWFEFLMMKLVPKILPAFCDMEEFYSGLNGDNESESYKQHPIDYLYEKFKKIKL